MEKFCLITPDRADRPEFIAHCLYQMERQTIKPGDHFIINDKPVNDEPDLIPRVRLGIEKARAAGYDIVFIIENDDYYPDNYLENMMNAFASVPELEAVGVFETLYYHIFEQGYKLHKHPERSSLFCTAFRISSLDRFEWPDNKEVFLDLVLWQYFKRYACLTLRTDNIPVGIKHGVGLCGGKGHNGKGYLHMQDENYTKLAKLIRPESLAFYKRLAFEHKQKELKYLQRFTKHQETEQKKYTEIWQSQNYESRNIIDFAKLVIQETEQDGRILEIGCGNGKTTLHLRDNMRFALACDITLAGIPKEYKMAGIFFEAPAWRTNFADMQFEYTCSTDVLEHIPTELIDDTIKEIYRLTKRKTIHVISTEPDKKYNGHEVHLTVKPIEWWREQFARLKPASDVSFILLDRKELANLKLN